MLFIKGTGKRGHIVADTFIYKLPTHFFYFLLIITLFTKKTTILYFHNSRLRTELNNGRTKIQKKENIVYSGRTLNPKTHYKKRDHPKDVLKGRSIFTQ